MIYSIGKRIKNYLKVRIYQYGGNSSYDINQNQHGAFDSSEVELKKWYYDNGRLKAETFHKNGKLEGIANYYYESGNLKAREFYRNNQLNGLSKWYYESGEVKSERYYREGSLELRKEFDKAGKLINSSYT